MQIFFQNEFWPSLGFHVYLADILADDAKANELHAADKAYDAGHARPAGDGFARQRGDDRPYNAHEAQKCNDDAEAHDKVQRFYRQTGYAVCGEGEHFAQRILALTGDACGAGVFNAAALKAHERYHAAQKEVDLPEAVKLPKHT